MKKIPFLLDGAMGTELNNRGVKTELPLWTADANILHPDLVQNIHSEYIDAGADYITTNTFRSTSWTCLLYTSPSPRDRSLSRMPSSA